MQTGHGYLLTMAGGNFYMKGARAQLLFASASTTTYTVRATTVADCQVDLSAFNAGDNNLSNVHLYALHSTDNLKRRLISFTASTPVRIFIGGQHEDTFGATGGTEVAYLDTATTASSFYFVAAPGDYTLVIGADQLPGVTSSTLTIGGEQPIPLPGLRNRLASSGGR